MSFDRLGGYGLGGIVMACGVAVSACGDSASDELHGSSAGSGDDAPAPEPGFEDVRAELEWANLGWTVRCGLARTFTVVVRVHAPQDASVEDVTLTSLAFDGYVDADRLELLPNDPSFAIPAGGSETLGFYLQEEDLGDDDCDDWVLPGEIPVTATLSIHGHDVVVGPGAATSTCSHEPPDGC